MLCVCVIVGGWGWGSVGDWMNHSAQFSLWYYSLNGFSHCYFSLPFEAPVVQSFQVHFRYKPYFQVLVII